MADQDCYCLLFSPLGQDEDEYPSITLNGVNSLICWMWVVHGQLGLLETGLLEFVQSLLSVCALSKHAYMREYVVVSIANSFLTCC